MIVVLDADILSSLAKIKRLDLIKSLFSEYEIVVPSEIYEEILRCKKLGLNFVDEIEEVLGDWLGIQHLSRELEEKANKLKTEAGLGHEADAIVLAKSQSGIFLSNDNNALNEAEKYGVPAFNLQNLIQDAILDGLINSSSHIRQIKADLKRLDYFEFKPEINQYLVELSIHKL